jgi:hypothetical protein
MSASETAAYAVGAVVGVVVHLVSERWRVETSPVGLGSRSR